MENSTTQTSNPDQKSPRFSAGPKRPTRRRDKAPINALTLNLIQTYKKINNRYYEARSNKGKKEPKASKNREPKSSPTSTTKRLNKNALRESQGENSFIGSIPPYVSNNGPEDYRIRQGEIWMNRLKIMELL